VHQLCGLPRTVSGVEVLGAALFRVACGLGASACGDSSTKPASCGVTFEDYVVAKVCSYRMPADSRMLQYVGLSS
jgi:hypothetical protein